MKEVRKAILNNLNDSAYEKNKLKVQLYAPGNSNNEELLPKSAAPYDDIESLSTYVRTQNMKVYVKNILKLKLKKFNLIGLPIILGAISVWALTSSKTGTEETNVYKKYHIEFDEENLLEYDSDGKTYVSSLKKLESNEENLEYIHSLNSVATVRFGNGKDSYECYFDITKDDEWSYTGYNLVTFIDLPNDNKNGIEKLNEKYSFIIDEVAKVFMEEVPDSKETIEELLSNQKNDIMVEIDKYIFEETKEYPYTSKRWGISTLMIVIDVIYSFLAYYYRKNFKIINALRNENGLLNEDNRNSLKLKYAKRHFQEVFLEAEKNRIKMLGSIVKEYSADQAILTNYEKKLILDKKE